MIAAHGCTPAQSGEVEVASKTTPETLPLVDIVSKPTSEMASCSHFGHAAACAASDDTDCDYGSDLEAYEENFHHDEYLFSDHITLYQDTDNEGEPQVKVVAELYPPAGRRAPRRASGCHRQASKESMASQSTFAPTSPEGSFKPTLATPDCSTALGSFAGAAAQRTPVSSAAPSGSDCAGPWPAFQRLLLAAQERQQQRLQASAPPPQSVCCAPASLGTSLMAPNLAAQDCPVILGSSNGVGSQGGGRWDFAAQARQPQQLVGREGVPWPSPQQPAGQQGAQTQIESASSAGVVSEQQLDQAEVTTLVVRNLPSRTTQREFLQEVDSSGFEDAYDFAYLPCGAGHAFLNFKAPEFAAAFKASWHWSVRFGANAGSALLNVVASVLQGFRANTRRWTTARMARVKNEKILPFIADANEAAGRDPRLEGAWGAMSGDAIDYGRRGCTTLVVQNLSEYTTQQEFLEQVNRSGFAGTYDFAYLPRSRDSGRGSGHAFVNFHTLAHAATFQATWHGSTRLTHHLDVGAGHGVVALNVAPSACQGFQANASKWTAARKAQVKNSNFLPFIFRRRSTPAA